MFSSARTTLPSPVECLFIRRKGIVGGNWFLAPQKAAALSGKFADHIAVTSVAASGPKDAFSCSRISFVLSKIPLQDTGILSASNVRYFKHSCRLLGATILAKQNNVMV